MSKYVHGYSKKETTRLQDQAQTLVDIIHGEAVFPPGSRILEPGCGTGAQTLTLATNNPESSITSMDISDESIEKAKARVGHLSNVDFKKGAIYNLPFEDESYDHVFVCFVLEHLENPDRALVEMKRVLIIRWLNARLKQVVGVWVPAMFLLRTKKTLNLMRI